MPTQTLAPDQLHKIDAYWRAANYLSVGQIYLFDNPLLKRPLTLADIKPMLLGTTPGQNCIYAHLNRVIKQYDLDMIYVSGPGHGDPAVVANTYLEGTYSEIYPHISPDLKQAMHAKLIQHRQYINQHGQDLPEIRNWQWNVGATPSAKPLQQKMTVPT